MQIKKERKQTYRYSYTQLAVIKPAKAPGQDSIGTGGQNSIGANNLEVYADKYDNASTDYDRAKVINYAINHLYCNIQPNLRIDLLADSQAELAKLEVSNA